MRIIHDKLFMAMIEAYARMEKNERMRKLRYDGSKKLVAGIFPFTRTVAEFDSTDE